MEPVPTEWRNGEFVISTDRERLDMDAIHEFLDQRSYWAAGRPRSVTERAFRNSLCFGLYAGQKQAGFARVVTDYATFAWVADVFVLEQWRGRGLSKWLMQVIVEHPELQGLRRWVLTTKDGHGLYEKAGFAALDQPERFMHRFVHRPAYRRE